MERLPEDSERTEVQSALRGESGSASLGGRQSRGNQSVAVVIGPADIREVLEEQFDFILAHQYEHCFNYACSLCRKFTRLREILIEPFL